MNSTNQLQIHLLSKNQQRLLKEMSHLYELSNNSLNYCQDVLSDNTNNLPHHSLTLHMAAMAFNINVLSGKTAKLISETIVVECQDWQVFYCYGLKNRPWEFVVHASFYNLPVALIDIRSWRIYKEENPLWRKVNLNIIAMKLKSMALNLNNSNSKANLNLIDKSSLLVSIILIGIFESVLQIAKTFAARMPLRHKLRLLKHNITAIIKLTTQPLNLTPIIDSIESVLPKGSWDGVVLLSKEVHNFGHHIWNDALGIVTTSQYIQMPQNLFIVEGPHDYSSSIQLLKIAVHTCKLSSEDILGGFWCSYPVLALRAFPVLQSAASQLAIQLTNGNTSANSVLSPTIKTNLRESSVSKKTQQRMCVVFTLRLGNRPWLNSLEALTTIAHYLAKLNSHIYFLIDGMTNFSSMKASHIETMRLEISLSSEIQSNLQMNGYDCHVITGLDLESKMSFYNSAGLFIQTVGSGDIIPHLILRKPIIAFAPSSMIKMQKLVFSSACGIMPPYITLEVNDAHGKGYTVNPEQVIKSITSNNELMDLFKS